MDAVERATRLVELRAAYHARLHAARSSALLLKLVDALFDLPAITISGARSLLEVTPPAANNTISRLVEAGILREATGRARNRVWVADEIRRAVE